MTKRFRVLSFMLITAATLATHGWTLGDGLFLDDHWHRLHWESDDWTPGGLLDATTINPENFLSIWWHEKPVQWQYSRPFAVLVTKAVYQLTQGGVKALHLTAILLHLAGSLLVGQLCWQLTRHKYWSVVGALLFVVYSHTVVTVAWIAAHNVIWQTVLMLAALLAYAKCSRLDLYAGMVLSCPADDAHPARRGYCVGALVLWLLAMFSRENAIVFPVLAASFDAAFGGRRHLLRRWRVHAVFAGVAVMFVAWRLAYFYHPMPDFYVHRWDGPGYIAWWAAKLLHYLTSILFQSPMTIGPSARYNPWREVPTDGFLMLVIVGTITAIYISGARHARGWWIWPLWIGLSILPVVPVVATPHSGYMPGVGFAVGLVVAAACGRRSKPAGIGRAAPAMAVFLLVAMSVYFPIYRALWRACVAAERSTLASVINQEPPPPEAHVFFINLPLVNAYAPVHLRAAWGLGPNALDADHAHVLTFAPDGLGMKAGGDLRQLGAHRFTITAPQDYPWFSSVVGRFLIETTREGRFHPDDRFDAGLFEVAIDEAGPDGVHRMTFTFARPLNSPDFQFYFVTNDQGAMRVLFGDDDHPLTMLRDSSPSGPGWRHLRDRFERIRSIARRVIRSDLYLTGPPFAGPRG